jgi:hypothetical protein
VLSNFKIGYVPYSDNLSQPGDRRRFPHFAKRKNIDYEIADPHKKYDLILLTAPGNLGRWLLYKKRNPDTIFIFEMVDSLIFSPDFLSRFFKGIGRFLWRKDSLLYFNYRQLIIKWIEISDMVLCSSTGIKSKILPWNKNVVVSLDYLEDEYTSVKKDFEINEKMKLVWEGQGSVLPHFLHFKKLFKKINSFCELHVITTEKYSLFGGVDKRDTKKMLKKLPIKSVFHKWDIKNKDAIISQCDCGIIPLNRKHLFGWHKPANKLISFWFTGLPTIVSDTPAYKELMNEAGDNLYCANIDDWIKNIHLLKNMTPSERENISIRDRAFAQKNYSDEALDKVWEQIFEKAALLKKLY